MQLTVVSRSRHFPDSDSLSQSTYWSPPSMSLNSIVRLPAMCNLCVVRRSTDGQIVGSVTVTADPFAKGRQSTIASYHKCVMSLQYYNSMLHRIWTR
jgi:hypothetical protein